MNDPVLTISAPRSHLLLALTMIGKLPIEQGLDAFVLLRDQLAVAEMQLRMSEAEQIMAQSAGGPK